MNSAREKHAVLTACNSNGRIQICTASKHGTAAAYRRGCRCDIARHQAAVYQQQRVLDIMHGRSRTLSNVGALRRLHALRALGYTSRDLAARIGVNERNICRWTLRSRISRAHFDAVCRVYDELADTIGPDERARRHAARQGWLPPLWWDDDTIDDPTYAASRNKRMSRVVDRVAIERFLEGDTTVKLFRADKIAAVQQLLAEGHTRSSISKTLRMSGSEVAKVSAIHLDAAC